MDQRWDIKTSGDDDGALGPGGSDTPFHSPPSRVPARAISVFLFDGNTDGDPEPVEIPMSLAV